MKIALSKFGYILISRQSGKEAYAAFLPTLNTIGKDEEVCVDFSGVNTFSPSWGDEFLSPLIERFGDRLKMANAAENPSVVLTLELLEKMQGYKFQMEK